MTRLWALLVALAAAAAAVPDCERTDRTRPGHVLCEPRTLGLMDRLSEEAAVAAAPVTSLTVRCSSSEEESFITNGTLSGLETLTELTLERCRLAELPAALAELTRLRSLTVRTFSDSVGLVVADSALHGLDALQQLELSHSRLTELPIGLLCSLPGLQKLNVSHNRLQEVAELGLTAGCQLPDLVSLDLSHNQVTALPSGALAALPALTELSVSHNALELLGAGALSGLPTLQKLDLSDNALSTTPAELLQPTPRLAELRLARNRLSQLPAALLRGLQRLLVLELAGNRFSATWINSETFAGLKRLLVLDLAHNRLGQIDASVFAGLYSLQSLQLHHNQIDDVAPNAFEALSNLHTLGLSHNKLHRIGPLSLNGLFVLNTLSLDNNIIDYVHPSAFSNASSLQELSLSDNRLTQVPEAVSDLQLLKVLDLGNNYISAVGGAQLAGMQQLFSLRLEGNVLTEVTHDMLRALPHVRILNLSGNRIQRVEPGAFESSGALEAVRLDANQLTQIDGLFAGLSRLRWLNVSDNSIARFDYASVPRGLVWLDLHRNEITELSNRDDIADQMSIRTLDVSFNRLTELSGFHLPRSIELLLANDNLIQSVEQYTFFLMSNLSRVDLFANQITNMNLNALRLNMPNETVHMPQFYIGGNPFVCDCNMEWLQRYNKINHYNHYPRIMDLESIYCRLIYNRGRSYVPLVDADASMFLCPYQTHCFTTCHCCDFDACDCEMTCPAGCRCYHDQSWSSNIIDCSNNNFEEIPGRLPMDATEVYLDGNNFKNLSGLTFLGRKNMKVLYLNNSKIEFLHNQTFAGLTQLTTLHLESNLVTEFNGQEFVGLDRLRELYLQDNQLTRVQNKTFEPLRQLEVLRLDGNQLEDFSVWELEKNPYLVEIGLTDNVWTCACDYLRRFQGWLTANAKKVVDFSSLVCRFEGDAEARAIYGSNETCYERPSRRTVPGEGVADYLPLLVSAAVVLLLLAALTAVVFAYRAELRVWIYSRCGVRVCYRSALDEEQERLFDAFVSYSERDKAFVQHVLAPKLEHGEPPYRLALHYRDFAHSAYLADTIVEAVESSRRTIMVLSRNFIENEWCRFQFKSAHHEVLKDRQKRLIVILLGDVPQRDLDPDLRLYLKTNTCISWDDKLFWDKLRFSMPDIPNNLRCLRSVSHYSEVGGSSSHYSEMETSVSHYSEISELKQHRPSPKTIPSLWE
ncbi:Toll-like receptor 6 [Amphibalanus amphitrite]|uniref:Toll-like receptor 6 n=1 Tax=Amphibalanus amphitrite TaxID=1232801 RepID=A0A6A4WNY0_AMPAM|nr:Toll-like receptor 6 [Amphibalanus amphitrite]